ncbi:flagellar assembly protein FliW [Sporosarcina sp. ANT_H38]|uniref:flagellar assembly protein FliW n=1 Tax=Sporosarcina sp. ANT_H38 TaxID=2597358 RepID=UPI0011F3AF2C|nr:flagellar assembly protein FliW [Sporosarcina sp. ANT_H38]KAA0966791.1 flagellar assembly protein FliW [Sporosarcina sp. ANT_H38]
MYIQTKFHGELNIQPNQTWNFPKGIPGFDDETEFALLSIEGNHTFQVLQSTVTPDIAFIVANPYTLVEDYTFNIDEPTIDLLQIKNEQDVFVLGVLSLKEPFESSTINLHAPLIFQSNSKKAKQMILNDNTFSMRHPIGNEVTVTEGQA